MDEILANISFYFTKSMADRMITITDSAQTYLLDLLQKQEEEGISIRIFVADAGTPNAETCIAYCKPGEESEEDESFEYTGFNAWIELKSQPFLEGASEIIFLLGLEPACCVLLL